VFLKYFPSFGYDMKPKFHDFDSYMKPKFHDFDSYMKPKFLDFDSYMKPKHHDYGKAYASSGASAVASSGGGGESFAKTDNYDVAKTFGHGAFAESTSDSEAKAYSH
jgi:hypothetical protein